MRFFTLLWLPVLFIGVYLQLSGGKTESKVGIPESKKTLHGITPFPSAFISTKKHFRLNAPAVQRHDIRLSDKKKKMSDHIREIITNFKTYGNIRLPNVSDPLRIKHLVKLMEGFQIRFTNVAVYGLSAVNIDKFEISLETMTVNVTVFAKSLTVFGFYDLESVLASKKGSFNVTVRGIEGIGSVVLRKNSQNKIEAEECRIVLNFLENKSNFSGSNVFGPILSTLLPVLTPTLIESIKPYVLNVINEKLLRFANTELMRNKNTTLDYTKPIEIIISAARKFIKANRLDPYRHKKTIVKFGTIVLYVDDFILEGLSKFHKAGDIIVRMEKGTVYFEFQLMIIPLKGILEGRFGYGNLIQDTRYIHFFLSHMLVEVKASQSLDLSKHPVIRELNLRAGYIHLMLGGGTSVLHAILNYLSSNLPSQMGNFVANLVKAPLKRKLQTFLNGINMEKLMDKGLLELDKLGL